MFYGFGTIPFNARILVPLTSMANGKSLVNTVVAALRVVAELTDQRADVEACIALDLSSKDTSRACVKAGQTVLMQAAVMFLILGVVAAFAAFAAFAAMKCLGPARCQCSVTS